MLDTLEWVILTYQLSYGRNLLRLQIRCTHHLQICFNFTFNVNMLLGPQSGPDYPLGKADKCLGPTKVRGLRKSLKRPTNSEDLFFCPLPFKYNINTFFTNLY